MEHNLKIEDCWKDRTSATQCVEQTLPQLRSVLTLPLQTVTAPLPSSWRGRGRKEEYFRLLAAEFAKDRDGLDEVEWDEEFGDAIDSAPETLIFAAREFKKIGIEIDESLFLGYEMFDDG